MYNISKYKYYYYKVQLPWNTTTAPACHRRGHQLAPFVHPCMREGMKGLCVL